MPKRCRKYLLRRTMTRKNGKQKVHGKTEHTIKLTSKEESKTVIDTDWEKAGVSAENFDDVMALKSTNMAQRYVTDPFEKAVTVQGTVCLNLKAALKDGNIETDFDPENRNDVDTLTMQLGNSKVSGKMDDVEIAVLLCDVCDEEFDSIQTVDPERNIVPVTTVKRRRNHEWRRSSGI